MNKLDKKIEDYADAEINSNEKTNEKACFRSFMKASGDKSSEDPFYDRKGAEERAISFIVDSEIVSYDLSCMLKDPGMLPDVCLKSLKGKEYAKEFMRKNAQFLTDYFHRRHREKDLPDMEKAEE